MRCVSRSSRLVASTDHPRRHACAEIRVAWLTTCLEKGAFSEKSERVRQHSLPTVALAAVLVAASPSTISQSGLVLQSTSDPRITLRIADGFVPLGPITLSLESTDVDRRVFVDSDAGRVVKRLVIVQFERVRSDSSFRFVYPPKPPLVFGGETYRMGAYVYDEAKESAAAPDREAGVTRAALTSQGYRLPNFFRTARLARVANTDGTSEIIFFYLENVDSRYPSRALPGADEDGDLILTGVDATELLDKLSSAISVGSPP